MKFFFFFFLLILRFKADRNYGRHVICNHDIRVGEVLVAEHPFVYLCVPEHFETHCYHCLRRTAAPIPCTKTSSVVFCSKVQWFFFFLSFFLFLLLSFFVVGLQVADHRPEVPALLSQENSLKRLLCFQKCRQEAWAQYYQYEWQYLNWLGLGWCGRIGHLVMRIVTTQGHSSLVQYLADSGCQVPHQTIRMTARTLQKFPIVSHHDMVRRFHD